MKNLILILAILLTSSSWAKSLNDCLDTECLRERATNFKAFLKAEEDFTNELGKAFPNSMLDKLVTNFVDEIRMDFNNANIDRETTLSQMKNNIRDNGIHAAFVDPAIVFMDMYASLGKKDKVQSMANIVNTLNPAIGDTLEKNFGIKIDRNYDPNFDAPKRQLNLPSNFNPTKREQSKDQFGGPRMGQFGNEFDGSLGAPEIDKENGMSNGLKPRMGNSGPGMNEGEMISPILANKLEQDKNSLLYSVSSSKDDLKNCLINCAVGGGIISLVTTLSSRSPIIGASSGVGTILACAATSCTPKKKEKSGEELDSPRTGNGSPDVPEDKPKSPKVDNEPRRGDSDKPKKDEGKPKKGEDKPKKNEVEPKEGQRKPKKVKKPKNKNDDCEASTKCKLDNSNGLINRTKSDDQIFDGNMINFNPNRKLDIYELQINFGRPQFGL
ncbi:hypothetical protein BALOs_0688 [Halobacteriovorax sp. BALOs_7]|uniref:hypothetical protein n=1 Tax=Halobacteriovorax sp. BALOs_7 TaxID=2109558 RepID=UPI000EA3ECB7|nr:hypothetical protein [Halobacteriovorax sp. BALOs_7]AYF43699.1 hypothetical protein BALOs_0688 [Halobacteriovorax sp. BALOs_7]